MLRNMTTRKRDESECQSAKTIAFVHHKGGTGKTTSALNIAGWLTKMKKKVLVIDLDPQGNATTGLGVDRRAIDGSIYDVLFVQKDIREIVLETDSGIFLAPSSLDLLAAETHKFGQINNTGILRENLSSVETYFDFILIDLPPGSSLLVVTGIVASENIIIPVDAGVFAYETMENLKTFMVALDEELGVEANIMMILLRGHSIPIFGAMREVKKFLREFLTENNIPSVKIFTILFSHKIYKAQMRGMPISHYAPHSIVGRVYKKIAAELLSH